jgi:hypothetical protein
MRVIPDFPRWSWLIRAYGLVPPLATSICNAIESHDTWVALGNSKCIYSSERRRAAGLVTFKPSALALQVAVRQLRNAEYLLSYHTFPG